METERVKFGLDCDQKEKEEREEREEIEGKQLMKSADKLSKNDALAGGER